MGYNNNGNRGPENRRSHRVVGGWSAIMDMVARRKSLGKDKYEPFFGVDPAVGPNVCFFRSWIGCLALCCFFILSAGFLSQRSPYGSPGKTSVTINLRKFSELPAFTTEERGIPTPDAVPFIYVQDAVLFPDNVMLLLRVSESVNLEGSLASLECRFGAMPYDSENRTTSPVISIKPRTKDVQMVRCALPTDLDFPATLHSNVTLGIRNSEIKMESNAVYYPRHLPSWENLAYENLIDGDTVVLLAKGLVTKSSKKVEAATLRCVFGKHLPSEIMYETAVLTAAQEVIRCEKPPAYLDETLRGSRVSIKASGRDLLPSVTYYDPGNNPRNFLASFVGTDGSSSSSSSSTAIEDLWTVPLEGDSGREEGMSIGEVTAAYSRPEQLATIDGEEENWVGPKRKLCACTMVWNKAQFIKEWVLFHSFMGVEQYFVYDNDSDDDTIEVLDSLAENNVSRMVWPWIKTQQAAFSHCTILAKDQCEWMVFTDVDEYIYPYAYLSKVNPAGPHDAQKDALVYHRMIEAERHFAEKRNENLGQIQFDCHNFGPSGLKQTPARGVTVGYTCRLKNPERHKSIIRLDALDSGLLNVLHHFELQEGFHSVKLSRRVAVCNHYKFQAWDAFKMKFVRRAGTYTTDWQKNESRSSKDRTPGLGTEAVRPPDWESRFCQVHDSGLRDFSLRTFSLPGDTDPLMVWQVQGEARRPQLEGEEVEPNAQDEEELQ